MRIALWAIDPFTESEERFSALGWTVRFVSPRDCGRALLEGDVDLALVPAIEVLKNTAVFTVLPGVAFASARKFPYANLVMNRPVVELHTIAATPEAEPFLGIASIVLREQYDCRPKLVRDEGADAVLHFGSETGTPGEAEIDLGLEWFELTGTPLVWGFFSVRPDAALGSDLAAIQDELAAALSSSRKAPGWDAADEFRVGYDPDVSEGIDELAHNLFYVGILDDIPALRLMATQN